MDTGLDSSVDSEIKSRALSTTQTHVSNATLETLLLSIFGGGNSLSVVVGGPFDTLDDIRHATTSVASENLDGLDMSLLCNTEFLACNSAGAVSSVTVAILISITLRNGLSPAGSAFEIDVVNVGTSVNNIGGYAFTTIGCVEVLNSWLA